MAATSRTPQQLRDLWGPVGQIGYVVHDLASAMQQWTDSVGVGPWTILDPAPFDWMSYKGSPCEAEVAIGLAYLGDVQIELIAQRNDAPSLYRDQLSTYGEGVQHVCFYPTDYQAALAAGVEAGLSVAQQGQIWGISFAYLQGEGGRLIELGDLSDDHRAGRQRGINTAAHWDG
jgi:hypothetical protein